MVPLNRRAMNQSTKLINFKNFCSSLIPPRSPLFESHYMRQPVSIPIAVPLTRVTIFFAFCYFFLLPSLTLPHPLCPIPFIPFEYCQSIYLYNYPDFHRSNLVTVSIFCLKEASRFSGNNIPTLRTARTPTQSSYTCSTFFSFFYT